MHFRLRTSVFCATLAAATAPASASAADWNQWRGPNRDGVAAGFKAPATWTPNALAKKWSVTVGEGHASPVVAGDRVYVFSREGDREIMRCLALADGKLLWRETYEAPYEMNFAARGHGKGPKATPVVAAGRVFALGIAGHFSAWDAASGRVLWRKDFAGEFKAASPDFGASASPIVDGENVIIHVGGNKGGALTAFAAATGSVKWKWTGDGPAYTSPVIGTFGGVRQLITQSQKHCLAVSPADGKLLWEIPFTTSYDQNIITPILMGDTVIFAGIGKPTFAVKVSAKGADTLWEAREITMYMSSPVLSGTRLHGMSDKSRGSLFTLDAKTGQLLWKSEGKLGANASVTDIGGALLVLNDAGELTVHTKSDAALKEVARYKVTDTPVWASPALAGDRILIKDLTTLTLFAIGS
ncbi:MAG: PQQ-binding-like beta-propeller repeat protein [Verrucomicrobia bacterium]|nr:PQQ-binding-like beta-propeller repeat protein [Verrucomicrobiota bacterium]